MILSTNKSQIRILVCTQKRYAPNPICCANSGSVELLASIKATVAENNLNIEIKETKCMLLCEEGPNVRLNPKGKIWNHASHQTIPDIISSCKKLIENA